MKNFIRELPSIQASLEKQYWFIFLDFDGTLTPIVQHPKDVKLDSGMKRVLKEIATLKNTSVAIISGRGLKDRMPQLGAGQFARKEFRRESFRFSRKLRMALTNAMMSFSRSTAIRFCVLI